MMKKIYLSAGHSAVLGIGRDNGAAGNGYVEGVEADIFRDLVVKELRLLTSNVITDGDNTILADTLKEFKKTADQNSILVEFHFNAASPQATGTEVLVPNNPSQLEKSIASAIANEMATTIGIKNRGVKTESESARGSLGWMKIPGENILPEICFISNKTDMEKYQANKSKLAKNIANILFDFSNDKEKIHIVVAGDNLTKIAAKYKTTISKIKSENLLNTDNIQVGQKLRI